MPAPKIFLTSADIAAATGVSVRQAQYDEVMQLINSFAPAQQPEAIPAASQEKQAEKEEAQ